MVVKESVLPEDVTLVEPTFEHLPLLEEVHMFIHAQLKLPKSLLFDHLLLPQRHH